MQTIQFKTIILACFFYLFASVVLAQPTVTAVLNNHEQVVLNDQVNFSVTGIKVVDEIKVWSNVIKSGEGKQLVIVQLSLNGKKSTKFRLNPTDFVAINGDSTIYLYNSIAIGLGDSWITNEFESLGNMNVTVPIEAGINVKILSVAFRLPKSVKNISVMSKTVASIGQIVIP